MSSSSKASQRINALLDENSFVEVGALVTARATNFNLSPVRTPSDGVTAGYGTINGNLVFVYAQDPDVLGGSIGEMHAKKIAGIYDMAIRMGAPVIGLLDSTGIRLEEGTDALNAFGLIYAKEAKASGLVPTVSAVFGTCGGGLALVAGMSDFTFIAEGGKLFVNSPNAIPGSSEDKLDTAKAAYKAKSGSADGVSSEDDIYGKIRCLIDLLPSNNEDDAFEAAEDDLNRASDSVEAGIADPAIVAGDIADGGLFFETREDYAREMVTGFIKLGGQTVGVVGNRTASYDAEGKEKEKFASVLTTDGCLKAARFVRFCDAFEIPVVTLTNVTGFAACECEEKSIAQAAASLVGAFAEDSAPKINVIAGAIGSAYAVMNSKALGCDITIALQDAKIGVMDAAHAAQILAGNEDVAEVAKKYDELQNATESAAARGYVDQIVAPADLRKYLIGAVEMLYTKREETVSKKHTTV